MREGKREKEVREGEREKEVREGGRGGGSNTQPKNKTILLLNN